MNKTQKIYLLIAILVFSTFMFWSFHETLKTKRFISSFSYQESYTSYYSIYKINRYLENSEEYLKIFIPKRVLELTQDASYEDKIEINDSLIIIKVEGPLQYQFDKNGNFKKIFFTDVLSQTDYEEIESKIYPYIFSFILNPTDILVKINYTSPMSFFVIFILFITLLNLINYLYFEFHLKVLNLLYYSITISIFCLIFSSFLLISYYYLDLYSIENLNSIYPFFINTIYLVKFARFNFTFASMIVDIQVINFILLIVFVIRLYFYSLVKKSKN